MKPWLKLCWRGACFCSECALAFGTWTLWLALVLLLAAQIGIAVSHELAVPRFLLRSFEDRLAASHMRVTFGRAAFDPSGAIIIENLRVSLPGLGEPVAHARATFIELDPWALVTGNFEPRRIRATGISLSAPAMLSTTGRSQELLADLELDCLPGTTDLDVEHLTAHVAGIAVTVHGTVLLGRRSASGAAPLPVADYFVQHYPDICRRLLQLSTQLAQFEQPALHAELVPSETRGAIATITVSAAAAKLTAPWPITAKNLSASTRLTLLGDTPTMAPLAFTAAELDVAGVSARQVQARVRGTFRPSTLAFAPGLAEITASTVASRGFNLDSLALRLESDGLPQARGELVARLAGEPVALRGSTDLAARSATLHFDGLLAPSLLDPIGQIIKRDLRHYLDFRAPVALHADITLGTGWKFGGLTGRVSAHSINAHHVPLDYAGGEIELDSHHFAARHATAILGGNFATGSFEQEFASRRFRFLLEGRLRPLEISGWFQDWWQNFFSNFDFTAATPEASVDVAGWWGAGHRTTVFVGASCTGPEIRGARFDHVRTRLFIRPNFCDALEIFGTIGAGEVRGSFVRTASAESGTWLGLDFDAVSTIDPAIAGKILGPEAAERLAPFHFETPPTLKLTGHFDGPSSQAGSHQRMTIEGQSTGAFTLHDFPLRHLAFRAAQHDDEVLVSSVEAGFAEGIVSGDARVWGRGAERRIGFNGVLRNASLAQAVATLEQFSAQRRHLPAPKSGKFMQGKASVKLDLAASAEGRYEDMLSFRGAGHATLAGPGLGEVQLLGLLSELLNFTSLRFNSARANFRIEGPALEFPEVSVTGANSAIEAHGRYALDRQELDFKARVYPFQESKFFLQSVAGAMLTPLSNVLEVKLTGRLDKPAWSFVIGPTNFLRNLFQSSPAPSAPKPDPNLTPAPYLRR